ncbi:hypothetical protein ACLJJ6_10445 [Pediococcus siamensis]|uniref:hypothetical protein n=1 Tax=Pediococcus siamensis TaxID=381829 RepID=UPI0039A24329
MKKIKFFIKGSKDEQDWLNTFSKKGWVLTHVGRLTYSFEFDKKQPYIFTNYSRLSTEKKLENSSVKLIQSVNLKKINLFVYYYSTTKSRLTVSKGKDDLIVGGKIAESYKNTVTSLQTIWSLLGFLLFLIRIIYLTVNHEESEQGLGMLSSFVDSNLFWCLFFVWLLILLIMLSLSSRLRKIDASYRMKAKNYKGTYLSNKYVEINTSKESIDIKVLPNIGVWQLIEDKGNGKLYYRLQTIFTDEEIEKQIKEKVPDIKSVKITKWLGSFYLPIG